MTESSIGCDTICWLSFELAVVLRFFIHLAGLHAMPLVREDEGIDSTKQTGLGCYGGRL
ncbi:hypothetical protein CWI39_1020p0020 [Hamiltosporidium magnivora]|uniref:Uncharacterized protein n=1 Tax=Hamiltosporidium magnivora TaxID=148818 RepID=A0A4Q9L7F3_9MICR|nr:hypothetical protein CWI39_1020p0020 [Hamiltosporidium magnivora]